jgi:hypothetical protein
VISAKNKIITKVIQKVFGLYVVEGKKHKTIKNARKATTLTQSYNTKKKKRKSNMKKDN